MFFTTVYWEMVCNLTRIQGVTSSLYPRNMLRTQNAHPTNIMDGCACLWMNVFEVTHFFLWTSHMDKFGVGLFYYTINCPLVHMDRLRECVVWHYFPRRTYLMSTVRCATCRNFIGDQSRQFIFSRGKLRVISWLVVSFRAPRSTAYK